MTIEPNVEPEDIDRRAIEIGDAMARIRYFEYDIIRVTHHPTWWNRLWPDGWRLGFNVQPAPSVAEDGTAYSTPFLFEARIDESYLTDPLWKQKWLLKMAKKAGEIGWAKRYLDELDCLL